MTATIVQICSGLALLIGALTTARLRKRTDEDNELVELRQQVQNFRLDMLAYGTYVFELRKMLSDQGVASPEPPPLRSGGPGVITKQ